MPTSYDIEISLLAKSAVKSKGWELNTGIVCPVGSFNGATDHFSFTLHADARSPDPALGFAYVTGDANLHFDSTFNIWRVASTVTLRPGRYAGSFSLNRSFENTIFTPPSTVTPDFCSVSVMMQPINGPDDYEFQEPGDGPGRRPWPCFQYPNGDPTATDVFGLPSYVRAWANDACPGGPGNLDIDCFDVAHWPDNASY